MTSPAPNVVGNVYDKYATKNPVARALMNRFLAAVRTSYEASTPRDVLEVGCGEALLARHLLDHCVHQPQRFVATDLDVQRAISMPRLELARASIYELPYPNDSFDLVICCEVLEHLHDPERALSEVARVARRFVIVSTPWEPTWRLMNLARGHYLRDWGNTPGHVQHYSRRALLALCRRHMDICAVHTPLPWTVVHGATRR